MNNRAQRDAAVESVFELRVACVSGDARLQPGVASDNFSFWNRKIFHHAGAFRVLSKISVKKTVIAAVFVCVGERQLIPERIFLQEAEGVADADVVICSWQKPGAIEVGAEHYEQISTRIGGLRRFDWILGRRNSALRVRHSRYRQNEKESTQKACLTHDSVFECRPAVGSCWQLSDTMGHGLYAFFRLAALELENGSA